MFIPGSVLFREETGEQTDELNCRGESQWGFNQRGSFHPWKGMPVEVVKEIRTSRWDLQLCERSKKKNHPGGKSRAYKENSKEGPIYIVIIKEKGYYFADLF